MGPAGWSGHEGRDGSDPFIRMNRYGEWSISAGENIAFGFDDAVVIIVNLVIDDGVPSRGHRTNIFTESFTKGGVATGFHNEFGIMAVMTYAGEYA